MDQDKETEEQKKENAEPEEQPEDKRVTDADLEKVSGGLRNQIDTSDIVFF